jgi:hypothetical protein
MSIGICCESSGGDIALLTEVSGLGMSYRACLARGGALLDRDRQLAVEGGQVEVRTKAMTESGPGHNNRSFLVTSRK